jgi:hypothetical protein
MCTWGSGGGDVGTTGGGGRGGGYLHVEARILDMHGQMKANGQTGVVSIPVVGKKKLFWV